MCACLVLGVFKSLFIFMVYAVTLSGNTFHVSYHLCIRHTFGTVFELHQSSENMHNYFHIIKAKNMYSLSYAA